MLAATGLVIITCVLLGIMSKKLSPVAALISIPFIGALFLGFTPTQTSHFILDGLRSIIPVTAMIVFAILYFGVVSDAGMLDPIVTGILKVVGCKPPRITLGTALLALIIHLDGSGAVTIMLTVPVFLPLYDRLGMDRRILACIIAMATGTNFLPWIGAQVRSSIVLEVTPMDIYLPLIPVHVIGLIGVFSLAYWFGKREEKRLGLNAVGCQVEPLPYKLTEEQKAIRRPRLFWLNLLLTLAVFSSMLFRLVDAAVAFMIGVALALTLNYRGVDRQMARIDAHARTALMLGSVLMSAGAFVGIMKQTGVITAMAKALVAAIPQGMEHALPLLVAIVSMPMSLVFDPDSFYFGILPVLTAAYRELGGDPIVVARAAILGVHTTGYGVSPLTPSCLLLVGMTRLSLADHQRFSFFYLWGCSLLMVAASVLLGILPL
ncbi:Citrate transporter [uncultured delta proteobacterium]|uniref:Citrate transporter n=1 Tax=uncultured delta proteobacterium TaxID=34034 RepID=A0A212IZU5_9DELT|nr:Citrate transporter [uncultured delta proteobacterium]